MSTLQPSSIFYVHIFIARVNLKLLLFIFGHIRKWEIDKISLINAIKWGASILVNEISVYKGRLVDTLLNRSRSRPRTDVHLFYRSSSFLARKKIWSRFVRENYDSDLINSSNEMTPKKDIICENVCFVDPILSIANNWTNNNVFFYKKKIDHPFKGFFLNETIKNVTIYSYSFPVEFYSWKEIPMIKSPFTIVPPILGFFFYKLYIQFYIKRREMLYVHTLLKCLLLKTILGVSMYCLKLSFFFIGKNSWISLYSTMKDYKVSTMTSFYYLAQLFEIGYKTFWTI